MKRERVRTKDIFLREEKYNKTNKKETSRSKHAYIEEPVDGKYVYLVNNWHPFITGVPYKVCEEGLDWVKLRNGGKTYHVPRSFIEKD